MDGSRKLIWGRRVAVMISVNMDHAQQLMNSDFDLGILFPQAKLFMSIFDNDEYAAKISKLLLKN